MSKMTRTSTTAKRLQEAMDMRGMKQADLAKATDLARGTISNYLKSKYEPKSTAVNKLAKALNVSEMWLWGYDLPMERSEGQKKNDQLVELVTRLRRDEEFAEMVKMLNDLKPEQYPVVKPILSALIQK